MKKYISIFVVAVLITASTIISTNGIKSSDCLAEDPPVFIPPPYKISIEKLAVDLTLVKKPIVNTTKTV